MEDSEDYVETSDAEECEQIQASSNIYWNQVLNCTPPRKRIKVGKNRLAFIYLSSTSLPQDDLGLAMDQDREIADLTRGSTIDMRGVYHVSSHPLRPSSPSSLNKASPIAVSDATPSIGPPLDSSVTNGQNTAIEPTKLTEFDMILDEPRYPLRRRCANQLKPYTIEQLQYKQALSANPDAIVKFRSPTRGGRRRYSDAEGGNIWELRGQDRTEDRENWEGSIWQRASVSNRNRTRSPEFGTLAQDAEVQYPTILQDLSSTDEEEGKEFRALSKEARKRERQRRLKENLDRKNRVKSVPFSTLLFKGQSAQEPENRNCTSSCVRMS